MWWCLGNRGNRVDVNWDDWDILGMGLTCSGVSEEQMEYG